MAAKVNERSASSGKGLESLYHGGDAMRWRAAFLRNLQKSGLLRPREFHKAIATLPTTIAAGSWRTPWSRPA